MSDADLAPVVRELRLQNALLRLVNREALERERERGAVLSDVVFAALLEHAQQPIEAGALKTATEKATGQSNRTVTRRLAELLDRGLLERTGGRGKAEYVTTGLIVP